FLKNSDQHLRQYPAEVLVLAFQVIYMFIIKFRLNDRPEDGLKDKAKFYYEHIDYLESQYKHFGRILAEMLITVFQEEDKV
ncbi:MAG TPA: hypothetical protein GX520_07420, partial [Syntrophaceticus sp.]|nr:hypothetical protein [Syntrophaceticus sp.]